MNAGWLNREIAALFGLVRVPTGTPDVAGLPVRMWYGLFLDNTFET